MANLKGRYTDFLYTGVFLSSRIITDKKIVLLNLDLNFTTSLLFHPVFCSLLEFYTLGLG